MNTQLSKYNLAHYYSPELLRYSTTSYLINKEKSSHKREKREQGGTQL
jgi:hypothetical protein